MENQTHLPETAQLVCAHSEVPSDGTPITRTIDGHSIAVSRRSPGDETIVAFDSKCPHMKAPLRFGRVVEGEVICPWHFLRFDAVSGRAVACDKSLMQLKTYPVTLDNGNVYIQV